MSRNIKTIPTSDYDAVVATVQRYVDGMRIGSSVEIANAFHSDAIMYGLHGRNVLRDIKALYDFVDEHGKAPEIKARVDILAITPTTAVVRVDMEKDAIGLDYTDFHSLVKLDGKWQIIAKVFHLYESV